MMKVAIIGAGAISATHIEAYLAQSEPCKIVAISDVYVERAEALNERYGLNAKIYDDADTMLKEIKADLVSICTPPASHASLTIKTLKAGNNVLLEKPMATSLAECDDMIAAAKENGKILSVVSQYRYTGQYYKLKQLLKNGVAGKPLYISIDALFYRGTEYYDLDWRGRWSTEGGGCTLIHAIHFIDQLIWLCGMPNYVYAYIDNLTHENSEVEDFTEAMLRYDNGLLGRLTCSLLHHGERQGIEIQTDKGAIGVPFNPRVSKAMENGFPMEDLKSVEKLKVSYDSISLPSLQGHAGQIADVIKAIKGQESTYVTGEEARAAFELVQAIYKSATTRSEVSLPLMYSDDFYRKDTMVPLMPVFNIKTGNVKGFTTSTIKVGGSEYIEEK